MNPPLTPAGLDELAESILQSCTEGDLELCRTVLRFTGVVPPHDLTAIMKGLFNLAEAFDLSGDSAKRLAIALKSFRADHGQFAEMVRRSLADGALDEAKRPAHAIKGLLAQAGSPAGAAFAKIVEKTCERGDIPASREVGEVLLRYLGVFERFSERALGVVVQGG